MVSPNRVSRCHCSWPYPISIQPTTMFVSSLLTSLIFPIILPITQNKLCAWRHNMSLPLQVDIYSHLFGMWHLFRHVGYLTHQQQVDIWPFDLESGVRVTCDVGYLCANFSLPGLSVLELGPMYTRQTDRRQTSDSCLRNDLYCVEWDVKLYYTITIPYHTIPDVRQTSDKSIA